MDSPPHEASPEEDAALVAGVLAGGREPFDLLYARYLEPVHRLALRSLGDADRAEDATRRIFVSLLEQLPGWRGRVSLTAFVLAVARDVLTDGRPTPLARMLAARRRAARAHAGVAERLTREELQIYQLKYVRQRPVPEIARALGCSEATIRAELYRIHRALDRPGRGAAGSG